MAYISYDITTGKILGGDEVSIYENPPENILNISDADMLKIFSNPPFSLQKYLVYDKNILYNQNWPPSGFVEEPENSGNLREMTPQEKINTGIETIDKYRTPVIQSIVNEMNEREKPLLEKYSNGQQLSFPTRKKESTEWLALPTADRTVLLAQTNFSLLYQIVTVENGIINPTVDDITNAANSIKEKVTIFEQTLTALSNKKDLLIGKPEILDVDNVLVQPASGIYVLTVDELINYGDVKTKWDSLI